MDGYADVLPKIYGPHFDPSADTVELFSTVLPKYLDSIDGACAKGEFLVGANLTVADFAVG
jgi:glutathione S-transferase